MGTKKRPILVPLELIEVVGGQFRNNTSAEISSQLIKEAAMLPARRFSFLTTESSSQGYLQSLQTDTNVQGFGLNGVSETPSQVNAVLLPPPKLLYGRGRIVQPELKGGWNLAGGVQFVKSASEVIGEWSLCFFCFALSVNIVYCCLMLI